MDKELLALPDTERNLIVLLHSHGEAIEVDLAEWKSKVVDALGGDFKKWILHQETHFGFASFSTAHR